MIYFSRQFWRPYESRESFCRVKYSTYSLYDVLKLHHLVKIKAYRSLFCQEEQVHRLDLNLLIAALPRSVSI